MRSQELDTTSLFPFTFSSNLYNAVINVNSKFSNLRLNLITQWKSPSKSSHIHLAALGSDSEVPRDPHLNLPFQSLMYFFLAVFPERILVSQGQTDHRDPKASEAEG